ncbi:MAG: hypothetical protein ACUZ8E_07160 [Candidatus Anammoxibacter sp.]
MNFIEKLKKIDINDFYEKEITWSKQFKSFNEVWEKCENAALMLLVAASTAEKDSEYYKQVVLATCKCARNSLKYLPKYEKRPLISIQTTERWVRGKATMEEVVAAGKAAHNVANAAHVADYDNRAHTYADYAAYGAAVYAETANPRMAYYTVNHINNALRLRPFKGLHHIVRYNLRCPVL